MTRRVRPGAEPFRFDGGPIGALLLHGYVGSPASMRPMGEWLAERGISVVGPRLRGHGTSIDDLAEATWQHWEEDSVLALDGLTSRCSDVIVIGQSFGGALALHLGVIRPSAIRGIVVINPWVRDPRLLIAPVARLFVRSVKVLGNDIKKPGQDEVCYERTPARTLGSVSRFMRRLGRELPSMRLPLLVFSSPEDHLVKPANSTFAYQRAGSFEKDFVTLGNSYHVATLDYDAEAIFERTLRFARSAAEDPSAAPA